MKNAFTGEPMDRSKQVITEIERISEPGKKLKKLHEAELLELGEGLPPRPRARGRAYDIAPTNGTYCPDQVDQEGKDHVDVNKLMERVDPSGKHFRQAVAQGVVSDAGMFYDDFTTAPDFQQAQDRFIHAKQQFGLLDAKLRSRFDNDPAKFLEYIHDPKYLEEQYTLGLRKKPEVKEPDATLKDVVTAVRETKATTKKAGKGGDSDD